MWQRSHRSTAVGFGLLAVVGVAYLAGQSLKASDCSLFIVFASFAGVIVAFTDLLRPPKSDPIVGRVAGGLLLGWFVLATTTEQFAWAEDAHGIVIGIAWLVQPLVGGATLPSRGNWLAGLGCWAATFAGTAALTYSVCHVNSGMGLIVRWVS